MKKHIKHIKSQTGSITLYVLISMLFMTMLLATIYTLSSNNEIAARNATRKIREIYETGIDNMDEVYSKVKEAGKPKIDVESIAIEGESVVYTGKQIQLSIITSPTDATIGDVKWSSSNTGYATVDENGRVTGVAIGKITIIATVDGVAATHEVEVKSSEEIDVSRVVITGKNSVNLGEKIQLVAVLLPNNATNKTVTWVSSNESIATVDATGKVTGVSAGDVTITAIADGKLDTHEVKVTLAVTGLTLTGKSSIIVGERIQIQKHIEPSGAMWNSESWSSSNENIATVDDLGRVVGVSAGDVTITAVVNGITATHEIKVKNTVTLTYKAGIKTVYEEEVNIGYSGKLPCVEPSGGWENLVINSVDMIHTSTGNFGNTFYYDSELTSEINTNTASFNNNTTIYLGICPYIDTSAFATGAIVGLQKEETYTALGLIPIELTYSSNVVKAARYTSCTFRNSETAMGIGLQWDTNYGYKYVYVTYQDSEGNRYKTTYCIYASCLAKDTEILVEEEDKKNKKKKRKKKKIQDITYDDNLVVWDFDNGCFTTAKPIWIKKPEIAYSYNLIKFSDGSELKTIENHRIFNKEAGKFTYPMEKDTPIKTTTFNANGEDIKLVSKEVVEENIEYYNIITEYHINLFANGILTSCRLNNIYPIKNMKFIKEEKILLEKEELKGIDEKYIKGFRLEEQLKDVNRDGAIKVGNSLRDYIIRLINSMK